MRFCHLDGGGGGEKNVACAHLKRDSRVAGPRSRMIDGGISKGRRSHISLRHFLMSRHAKAGVGRMHRSDPSGIEYTRPSPLRIRESNGVVAVRNLVHITVTTWRRENHRGSMTEGEREMRPGRFHLVSRGAEHSALLSSIDEDAGPARTGEKGRNLNGATCEPPRELPGGGFLTAVQYQTILYVLCTFPFSVHDAQLQFGVTRDEL